MVFHFGRLWRLSNSDSLLLPHFEGLEGKPYYLLLPLARDAPTFSLMEYSIDVIKTELTFR